MIYKAVFSDIDGTVINSKHQLLPSTVAAVQQIVSRGIIFVLVSARMPGAIIPLADKLGQNIPLISYNGALILLSDKKKFYSKYLKADVVKKIIKEIVQYSNTVAMNYYTDDKWYVQNINDPYVRREIEITGVEPCQCGFEKLVIDKILPHKLLCMAAPKECQQLERHLSGRYKELTVIRSGDTLLEIIDSTVSKAEAIKYFAGQFNIRKEEIIAFGDNYNDIDMLEYAGMGIAMGNAPDEIKRAAKMVTDSNDSDGIYNALRKLKIIS
ncbi:Cof-type HAD-IIB family hydrolase [Pectinatus sottacetonis]|uniref:Cof-type HAD-IIB family hydrolase n=1 Tax=Pectinatus sottacetonis TaxID=1002795 RepID=UPI0018C5D3E3|nr:Cof-type HAD-IIB family hydrolase [Pectinatus sottacetonis]